MAHQNKSKNSKIRQFASVDFWYSLARNLLLNPEYVAVVWGPLFLLELVINCLVVQRVKCELMAFFFANSNRISFLRY